MKKKNTCINLNNAKSFRLMQAFFSSSLAYCANYLESLLIVVITNEFNNIEKKNKETDDYSTECCDAAT